MILQTIALESLSDTFIMTKCFLAETPPPSPARISESYPLWTALDYLIISIMEENCCERTLKIIHQGHIYLASLDGK